MRKPGKNASKKRIEQFNRGVWECNSCHRELSFNKFCKVEQYWSGLAYKCRECSTKRRNKWKEDNKFRHRANDMNRRAGKDFVTGKELKSIYQRENKKCYYCGVEVDIDKKGNAHFDHVVPDLDTSENIVLSCFKCNTLKSDGTVEDFQNFVKKIKQHCTEHEVAFV